MILRSVYISSVSLALLIVCCTVSEYLHIFYNWPAIIQHSDGLAYGLLVVLAGSVFYSFRTLWRLNVKFSEKLFWGWLSLTPMILLAILFIVGSF